MLPTSLSRPSRELRPLAILCVLGAGFVAGTGAVNGLGAQEPAPPHWST